MNDQETSIDSVALDGAGFGIRALARAIDGVFGLAVGLVAGFVASIFLFAGEQAGTVAPGWEQRMGGLSLLGFTASLVGNVAYHTICEGLHGATVGKLVCRLRVVRQDGRGRTVFGALIRSAAYLVDALFFGLVAYESMKKTDLQQRLGDRWGRTVVLRSGEVPAGARASVWRFLLGLFLGATVWGIVVAWSAFQKAS